MSLPRKDMTCCVISGFGRILVYVLALALVLTPIAAVEQHDETEVTLSATTDSSRNVSSECSGLASCTHFLAPSDVILFLAVSEFGQRNWLGSVNARTGRVPTIDTPPPRA